MATGHGEAACAENRGRPQDGADVVRIGYLVEYDQGTTIGGLSEVAPVGFGQGLRFERRSLMDGVGAEETIEIARGDSLDGRRDVAYGLTNSVFGVFRE
jgi:hypothetical protein